MIREDFNLLSIYSKILYRAFVKSLSWDLNYGVIRWISVLQQIKQIIYIYIYIYMAWVWICVYIGKRSFKWANESLEMFSVNIYILLCLIRIREWDYAECWLQSCAWDTIQRVFQSFDVVFKLNNINISFETKTTDQWS